ncbi:Regulatory protein, FmdB family [Verrucomicrobia bacterium]|nr:Regulatory protein, FmdB family [Verrucomicrobiota bacterium]
MPTYEYVCEKCGHHFEKIQSITAKSLTICPKELCLQRHWGKGHVKREISGGAGLLFKGSGFYITDYRSENYKAGAKKDAPAAAPAGGEGKSAGDTKTTAKAESKPAKPAPAKS